jgi:hypothetical protein
MLSFFAGSARRMAFMRASALSESATVLPRATSYVQTALPSAHMTRLPSAVQMGNSPPISFSLVTGTAAASGLATDTVGAVAPMVGMVIR